MNTMRFPLDRLFLCFVFFISANGLIIPIGRNFEIAQIIFFILMGLMIIKLLSDTDYTLQINSKYFILYMIWVFIMLISILNKPETFLYKPETETSRLQQYDLIGYMYLFWVILNLMVAIITYHFATQKGMFIKIIRIIICNFYHIMTSFL